MPNEFNDIPHIVGGYKRFSDYFDFDEPPKRTRPMRSEKERKAAEKRKTAQLQGIEKQHTPLKRKKGNSTKRKIKQMKYESPYLNHDPENEMYLSIRIVN